MKRLKKTLAMLLALCLVFTLIPATVLADKPADGSNSSQPFPTSIIGSGHYRIPAFVTTNNGTLVAAADARWHSWDTTDDNGDIDTIVSRSTDNGATWNYTFSNYIDNGNTTDYNAATFIDPALAYDGNTIYMIVDLYPGQSSQINCTSSSKSGTGYDSNGNLLLSTSATASFSDSNFTYYLSGDKILSRSDDADQGYTVDAYFNVTNTSTGASCGNLFDYNNTCGFHPLMTSHLYMTKSIDNGETWSEPVMLNSQVKDSDDTYYLVSPGRGLVTSDGTIIFGAYDNSGQASLIYSNDSGETWTRSNNSGFTSSENEIVELSNGTLRMFYRYGYSSGGTVRYVDITGNATDGYTWGSAVKTSASFNGNVNISAISYSKTYNGKQVIFVSCPADTSGQWLRYNGKIYTFTFDGSNMELVSTYDVDSSSLYDAFSYSCLTELSDGSIGMLYEKGDSGNITYINVKAEEISDLTFDEEVVTPEDVTMTDDTTGVIITAPGLEAINVQGNEAVADIDKVTKTYSITLNGGTYTDAATVKVPYDTAFDGCNSFTGYVDGDEFKVTKESGYFVCEVPHFSDVTIEGRAITGQDTISSNGATGPAYVLDTDGTLDDGAQYLIVHKLSDTSGVAMTYDGTSFTSTNVTINSDGTVTPSSDVTNALWTRTGTAMYHASSGGYLCPGYMSQTWKDAYYVGATHQGNGGYTLTGSWYNVYYNNGWVNRSNNTTTLYLYKYNASTTAYTVDAALQESRINEYTVSNAGYTDDSLAVYETALTAAQTKLSIVESTSYTSETAANTALTELIAAVNALETAKNNLVKAIQITVNYQADSQTVLTTTLNVAETATEVTLPGTVTDGTNTYTINNTTLALNGASSYNVEVTKVDMVIATTDTTPFVGNTGTEGLNNPIAGLVITTGTSYDLNISSTITGDVTWATTSDKITVDDNGTVTGVTATNGEVVYVTATVNGITYAIPVTVLQRDNPDATSVRTLDFHNTLTYNCTAYYSYQCSDLVEFPEGTQIYIEHDSSDTDIMCFYATPDDGYALTYVNGTGGSWFHKVLNSDETGYGYDSDGNGTHSDDISYNQGVSYTYIHDQLISYVVNNSGAATVGEIHTMLGYAVAKKCDGAFFFSRAANTGNINSSCTFIAEKLPEIYKNLSKVSYLDENGDRVYVNYVDGMSIGIGYTLHYTIYVGVPTMKYPTQSVEIDYTNFEVDDPLTGHKWTAAEMSSETLVDTFTWFESSEDTTGTSVTVTDYDSADEFKHNMTAGSVESFPMESFAYTNSSGGTSTYSDSTINIYAFETSIELGAGNFLSLVKDGIITNTADLSYTYQGEYSKGSSATASAAVAEVLVVVPEYVIDFGLPVEIDLTNDPLVTGDKIKEATAKYGTVEITGDRTLVYTPTTILKGTEFITLTFYDSNGGTATESTALIGYGVRIYPATSVYYEESFLLNNASGWITSAATLGNQESAELGEAPESADNFGYDSVYANKGTDTGYITGGTGASTSFTFTGTGFQLYGNSNSASGYVTVYSQGSLSKLYMINTKLTDVEGDEIADTTYYGLPFISETDLPYGTYTVQLKQTNGDSSIYLDGVRILNTINDTTTGSGNVYYADQEDNPDFYELRDSVLNAIGVEDLADSAYTDTADRVGLADSVRVMAGQVYNAANGATALILDESYTLDKSTTVQELLDNGPKNELYLYENQTLIFNVKTDRVVQLGMKAPTGTASFTLNGTNKTLNTSVDMFYEIATKGAATDGYTVTIKNTGDAVLSVTLLKICDDPDATFTALTQEDIENVLLDMYGLNEEPVVYADATLNIAVNDADGNALATTQLTANGIEGEEATFAAAEIQAAVAALELPDNYNLDDVTYSDVTVTYGSEDSVAFTAEKELTQEEKVVETVKQIFSSISNFFKKFFRW